MMESKPKKGSKKLIGILAAVVLYHGFSHSIINCNDGVNRRYKMLKDDKQGT